jgi:glycosyltransferase involved in cell wall biosynthesis
MSLLSIIIPTYNEEATIVKILDRIYNSAIPDGIEKEIIIVDDGSNDKTAEVIHNYGINHLNRTIQYCKHEINLGKGAAIRSGILLAKGEYVIIQDADLEYDPAEYEILLKPVLKGIADVVYGSRFMGGNPHRVLFFWHTIGNRFLTFLSNLFTNLNLTDVETGYKLFRTEILKKVRLKENRFGFEPEITAKIARIHGIRIYEVGISYYGRTFDEGKKINWKDGIRTLFCILKYNIFSRH